MKKLICILCALMGIVSVQAKSYDNPDTLFVSRDGTCEFRNIGEAIEVCRAFMEYHKVIYVKNGTYTAKVVWTSMYYDYMKVGGTKYTNENVGGTSGIYTGSAPVRIVSAV